jgi:SrtB family sortase
MLAVKGFNEKHRSIAAVTTFLTLLLVAILSAVFSVAIFICSLFGKNTSTGKRIAGIVMAGVLLCIAIFAAQRLTSPATMGSGSETAVDSDSLDQAKELETAEASITEPAKELKAVADATEQEEVSTSATTSAAISAGTVSADTDTNTNTTAAAPRKSWDTSDIELDKLMEAYPEMIGWVYFEDGHISYPIMHTTDNEKYSKLDYMGNEAPTGAIFLDYRSAADFSDANSIVYGHNMKDTTMFGSLREYRKDPAYYNDHMYFQIITPTKAYRYLIFEYMDVPETYVLYDYVAEAALEFVKDAEPVRIKSYMDSEIPVTGDSKVVTLSTCTKKDDLQFVVLGVLVEESDH